MVIEFKSVAYRPTFSILHRHSFRRGESVNIALMKSFTCKSEGLLSTDEHITHTTSKIQLGSTASGTLFPCCTRNEAGSRIGRKSELWLYN